MWPTRAYLHRQDIAGETGAETKEEPEMRTKPVLALVTVAMLAMALPASAQGPIDIGATLVMDEPVVTHVGEYTYIVVPNQNGGRFAVPYDIIVVPFDPPTPPEVRASDSQPRGPRHL
jgi:hypothetical protein